MHYNIPFYSIGTTGHLLKHETINKQETKEDDRHRDRHHGILDNSRRCGTTTITIQLTTLF
jgi:hypothetical protein